MRMKVSYLTCLAILVFVMTEPLRAWSFLAVQSVRALVPDGNNQLGLDFDRFIPDCSFLSELKTNLVWFEVSPSFIGSVPILAACPLD
jgi:hypothetical protein